MSHLKKIMVHRVKSLCGGTDVVEAHLVEQDLLNDEGSHLGSEPGTLRNIQVQPRLDDGILNSPF